MPEKRFDPSEGPPADRTVPAPAKQAGQRARRRFQGFFLLVALAIVLALAWRSPLGREFGLHCLGKLGAISVPLLRHALWDESFDVQAAAREELNRLGEKAVPSLVKSLNAVDARKKTEALHALGTLGSSGRTAVPVVIGLLDSQDVETRIQSLSTLGVIGENNPMAAAAVIRAMDDPDASVRVFAAKTLGDVRASGDLALPALMKALKADKDLNVRFETTVAFGRLNLRTPEAMAALQVAADQDTSPKVREEANEVLALLDPHRQPTPNQEAARGEIPASSLSSPTEVAVHVGTISVATLRQYVTAFGAVAPEPGTSGKAPASAKITSPLAGLVAEVKCTEGQLVEKGQVLFTLDGRQLDARIAQARTVLEAAEKNFAEQEKISKPDAAAQLMFAKARQEREQARGELEFMLAQQALLKVTTPLAGTVVSVNVRPGEITDPESPTTLVEIVDLNRLIISASVPAADLSVIKAEQAVEILTPRTTGDAQNILTGKVTLVEDRVDVRTDLGTVDVSLPAQTHLRCGQFVCVKIVAQERRDCLAVPSSSLVQNEDGEWVVGLVRGKLAVQVPVTPGLRDDGLVEVQSPAIKAGGKIVTLGAAALSPKSVIRILKD